jgi:copper chaperone NosL
MYSTKKSASRLFTLSRAILLTALLCLAFSGLALAAQKASGVPKDAKCPVCGMLVAKYPDWNGTIVYRDSTTAYFDGPKDLLNYYLNPRKYDPAKKRSDIAAVTVKDYYSLAIIDARQAYFVVGSNVLGPMGKELIPFAKKSDADGFRADHLGRKQLRFSEVTLELLKSLE